MVNISVQRYYSVFVPYIDFDGYSGVLRWQEEDSFQISPINTVVDCASLSTGYLGEWVYFQRGSDGKVVSLTIPGLHYELVYYKH